MEGTTSSDVFAREPIGCYLVGPCWIHWCRSADLYGVTLWGRPDRDSIARLTRSLATELGAPASAHQSLVDARRLESVDGEAFEVLATYVRDHHDDLTRAVSRLALVRPEGLAGAAVAGFFSVLDPPYPVELFDDAESACRWLVPDDNTLATELERISAGAAEASPLLAALRVVITASIRDVDVRAAARALGVSERSLQRKLKDEGTTFGAELLAARIATAQNRMLESEASLTSVALDVGFTSLSHFSTHFRRLVGVAPSVWRSDKSR